MICDTIRPVTRRAFALSLLVAPMACLGCGGESATVNTKVGEKRRRKMENLQQKANVKRDSQKAS
jgi:hypothetical protein